MSKISDVNMVIDSKEAQWWHIENSYITCDLCPHFCKINEGKIGYCGVRKNVDGRLRSLIYGKVCVSAVDQIEKKPIFHYRPGSYLFSVGTVGCNLDCLACQNFYLARGNLTDLPWNYQSPENLVKEALLKEVDGIAWTFNEPIVWSEYVIDTSKIAKRSGLYSMLNTNGFITDSARDELLKSVDVMKIDFKGFSEERYNRLCNGKLKPVLETCLAARNSGVHVELAYLLIPDLNDSTAEIQSFVNWVSEKMGNDIPLHFFRFSPAYKLLEHNPQSMEKMLLTKQIALKSGMKYIYFGGTLSTEHQSTFCPSCGTLLISRKSIDAAEKIYVKSVQVSRFCTSYSEVKLQMKDGKCPNCGTAISIRMI